MNTTKTKKASSKLYSTKILVKWADVLHGRKNDVQVWASLPYHRDYGNSIADYLADSNGNDSSIHALSYIYTIKLLEIALQLYLLVQSTSCCKTNQKRDILFRMERHSNSTSIDKIQNYNDKDYLTVNKTIDEVFGKAINECDTPYF